MIINKTKNKTISWKERYCDTIFSQALGLMFRRKQSLVMVFDEERKVKLHSWFVFYPIDILILDSNKRIVEIKRNFRPFSFWGSVKKGMYVVELGSKGEYFVGNELKFIPDLDEGELSRQTKKDIKQSREEFKKGKFYTFEEVKKGFRCLV